MNDLAHNPSEETYAAPRDLGRWGSTGLLVGLAGAVLLAIGYFTAGSEQFLHSYLIGWATVIGFPLGALALLMVYHLTAGTWGTVARRILEASTRTLPFMAVLFLPVALGMGQIYEWTHEELTGAKAHYLTEGSWLLRAALYLAVWLILALTLSFWSKRQDATGDPALARKMRMLSGPGLVLYGFAITFAAIDWIMSLDPEWYSTIYGAWFFGGAGIAALGFLIVIGLFLAGREPMADVITKSVFHDWGKLLLAFTMLWAYFAVSQLLIIWSGNIPEEVLWYHERLKGGWEFIGLAIALLHFALPFLLLLSRDLKRQAKMLTGVAGLLLFMHWVDIFWNIAPNFSPEDLAFHWMDLVAPLAIGGFWIWLFVRELGKRPLLPINDPYLEEVFNHGGH
jgi:hypothetical protein